jgi:hypothetical protein
MGFLTSLSDGWCDAETNIPENSNAPTKEPEVVDLTDETASFDDQLRWAMSESLKSAPQERTATYHLRSLISHLGDGAGSGEI